MIFAQAIVIYLEMCSALPERAKEEKLSSKWERHINDYQGCWDREGTAWVQ